MILVKLLKLCFLFTLTCATNAHEGHEHVKKINPLNAVKVSKNNQSQLETQTASRTLIDGDITLRIIAFSHLGNKAYHSKIAEQLLSTGPILVEGLLKYNDQKKESQLKPLTDLNHQYQSTATQLNLEFTSDLIFPKERQVEVADIPLKEFLLLSKKQRHSILLDIPSKPVNNLQLLELHSKSPYFVGTSNINDIRENILISKIHRQLIRGSKNITIIISAARMPSLEIRLQKQKFSIKTTTWLTAWSATMPLLINNKRN